VSPRSIGVRLTLWYVLAFAVAGVVLAGATYEAVRAGLYRAVDSDLRERVEGIRRFVVDHESRLEQDEVREEFRAHGDLFRVVDASGRAVHEGDAWIGAAGIGGAATDGADREFASTTLGGEPVRVLTRTIEAAGRRYVVQAAAPLSEIESGLRAALRSLGVVLVAALALSAAGGYWLSRRALAPVDRITRAAREITAESLARRLDVPGTGDELERLSTTLNEMIARLEGSFKRVARFTADASHELRTPLAVIRTTADVALRGSQPPGELRAALEQVAAEAERTSQLVENLLTIARADSGDAGFSRARVDLAAAVDEALAQAGVLARVKGVVLVGPPEREPLPVVGDAHALRRLFLILLDNAIKYTAAGGRVAVELDARGDAAIARVVDTGIGIPAEHLPHVFERFYRVDSARTRDGGGAGLGLAIARWIGDAHGASIEIDSVVDRGSTFTVRLPSA
jgi:heavy metal sensor kinase